MKKFKIFIQSFLLVFLSLNLSAQNVEYDAAIRNSQNIYGGSARFTGLGGAFTALGGDISSLSINPAGVGVYSGMQFVATPSLNYNLNKTDMLGYENEESKYKFNFQNIGLITAYEIEGDSRWKNFNLGLGYNQMSDYNNSFSANYFNKDYSLIHTYLDNAKYDNFRNLYENLAFQTYLINDFYTVNNGQDTIKEWWSPLTDEMNYSDTANVPEVGVNQNKYITKEGSNGEYFLSLGGNYSDKLYIGATIGIQRINYQLTRTHKETERADNMVGFHSFSLTEYENHTGTGYNFKIGAIYKPIEYVRIGAAIHTPTFFKIEYTFYNSMNTDLDGDQYSFESDQYNFSFDMVSPMKIETGVAVQVKDIGLLSVDYERVDYSTAKLVSQDEAGLFELENDSLNNTLTAANNLRFGGEVKLNQFYLRGGYALYQSPYSGKYEDFQSNTQIFSGGFGYREGSFFMDATFMRSMTSKEKYLYDSVYGLFNETTEIDHSRNRFIVTIGLRF